MRIAPRGTATALDGHNGFARLVSQALAQADRTGERLALHYLHLGSPSQAGSLLRPALGLGTRLRTLVRRSDAYASLGQRRFAFLQRAVRDLDGVTTFARKLLAAATGAVGARQHEPPAPANVGIALHRRGMSIDDLMTDAEKALHAAQAAGRGTFRYEAATTDPDHRAELLLQNDLQNAVAKNEFFLEFQPQVDSVTGGVRCVEALIRWRHPLHGVVAPGDFIPLAERTGIIGSIGAWVAREACRKCAAWNRNRSSVIPVAINVSAAELADPDFPVRMLAACRHAELAPDLLELELIERALVSGDPVSERTLLQIRASGIALSIDDFGTGYSSLQCLKALPARKLKIPADFVANVAASPADRAIVEASVRLGHGLRMEVVAEGVEKRDQATILRDLGCDSQQGFFFGRPSRHPHRIMSRCFAGADRQSAMTLGRGSGRVPISVAAGAHALPT